jgi:sugar (pentulose or hexulose) kinase
MNKLPVIAIFDIGKTNKKLFLFDEKYKIVLERTTQFEETTDEDGDACENIDSLRTFVTESIREILSKSEFDVRAINFTSYGASFVYLDEKGIAAAPIYNYLKPYPPDLLQQFYGSYGGEENFSLQTASPVLGNLNSGLQIYRLKYQKPELYAKIQTALHLPQYLSYLVSGKPVSEITSIGCHTNLWNFKTNNYHEWVDKEGVAKKLPGVIPSNKIISTDINSVALKTGVGLHDSSAALIPYLISFADPFILISTGTWCISMNPFNESPLTASELKQDCLCYMTYHGTPVKASRLFAGNEHEIQTKKLAEYFHVSNDYFKMVTFSEELTRDLLKKESREVNENITLKDGSPLFGFYNRNMGNFSSYEAAYHQLILDIMKLQIASTKLVANSYPVKTIFVDGGFSKNPVYMNLLANAFPDKKVFASSVPEATALGAALAIHEHWNNHPISTDLIKLHAYYSSEFPGITPILNSSR